MANVYINKECRTHLPSFLKNQIIYYRKNVTPMSNLEIIWNQISNKVDIWFPLLVITIVIFVLCRLK